MATIEATTTRRFAAGLIGFAFILLAMMAAPSAASTAIEKLMMPGPLSQAHAKLEEDCANCHVVLKKEAQSSLCLNCHKDVRGDVEAKRGFHGRDLIVSKSECFACHAEHKGRDSKLISFEQAIFNHTQTNYALEGAHKEAACSGCHVAGKKFRDAPHGCFDCHAKAEPHKGNLGKDCQNCHTVEGWAKVPAFDHEKTRYPLRGAHAKAQCLACHVGEIYKGLSTTCNDCHAIRDVHARKFGIECQNCHGVESWKEAKFDHNKQTKFPLVGAHSNAKCADCHGGNVMAKISVDCISCHKAQDAHKGQLGSACGDCHGVVAWRQNVKFDHGLTRYPLTGLHAAVACEGCHESSAFKGAPTSCISCHAKDDTHTGRFTTACANCHSTLGWQRVTFDHGRDGHYPLTGAHARLGCYDCHKAQNVTSARLPTDCFACHKAQDVHHGAFGQNCARCHGTDSFKRAIIRQ